VVGALSTGTHGGDFDRPPLADAVVALHLVADGGKHYWIERSHCDGIPFAVALDPNIKGKRYWGQQNDSTQQEIEFRFGDAPKLSSAT
jgi:hypothetical protein